MLGSAGLCLGFRVKVRIKDIFYSSAYQMSHWHSGTYMVALSWLMQIQIPVPGHYSDGRYSDGVGWTLFDI